MDGFGELLSSFMPLFVEKGLRNSPLRFRAEFPSDETLRDSGLAVLIRLLTARKASLLLTVCESFLPDQGT